jgi:hypothetical protein
MLDDPGAAAPLPFEKAAGNRDGPGQGVMIGMPAFVRRNEHGAGPQLAKPLRYQARQLREAMSTILVYQSERDRPVLWNASDVERLEQFVAPGPGVGFAIGEAVGRRGGHIARSAVRCVNDPHVAQKGQMPA